MTSDDWQPIDSAPTDTEILVYTRQWGVIVARHSEEHETWFSRMQVPVTLGEDEMPTHWRPVPAPPESVGEKGEGEERVSSAPASAP